MIKKPKIALVYDWTTTRYGGAERVLIALHQAFPTAPLFTSVADLTKATWARSFEIKTTFLQKFPGSTHFYRLLSFLMPLAFESFNFDDFDIVISVSSAEAKGVLTKPHQLHICYLLTPTRYVYSHQTDYQNNLHPFIKILIKPFLQYLRWWDEVAAARPDVVIPISKLVAKRCQTFYGRQPAAVIYPPVEIPAQISKQVPTQNQDKKQHNLGSVLSDLPAAFYLVLSRLVPYKRIELAIQACGELGKPLVVVGEGPQSDYLQKVAELYPTVFFLKHQSRESTQELMTRCHALLMPGIEDFGITALEAQSYGKPVILHQESGVAELLENGIHGVFLSELTVLALKKAIIKLEKKAFNPKIMISNAQKYATTTFVPKFQDAVTKIWNERQGRIT